MATDEQQVTMAIVQVREGVKHGPVGGDGLHAFTSHPFSQVTQCHLCVLWTCGGLGSGRLDSFKHTSKPVSLSLVTYSVRRPPLPLTVVLFFPLGLGPLRVHGWMMDR